MENRTLVISTPQFTSSTSHPQTTSLFPQPYSVAPVGIALLGIGRWGTHLLRNFLAQPQAQVIAVADPSADRLHTLAQQFQTTDRIVLTSDWETALAQPGIDAAVIATPAATHYDLIRSALQRGLHVLAEKPLTLNLVESLELCHLATQHQRQLMVDHTYLFHPAVKQGQATIHSGQVGKLRYGYASRTHLGPVRQDVDALWDLAIHDIAIFNYWLQETPLQVQAQGSVWLQTSTQPADTSEDMGLSDLVWVKLVYPSGFQAFIHLCWSNADKQRRLSVVGSEGTLVFDELATAPLSLLQGRLEQTDRHFTPVDQQHQVLPVEPIEPLQQMCQHFLDCVQNNTPSSISSGWVGAELVQILMALTTSLRQNGATVTVDKPLA